MVLRLEPLRQRRGIDAGLGYLGEHAVIEREHPERPVLPPEVREVCVCVRTERMGQAWCATSTAKAVAWPRMA